MFHEDVYPLAASESAAHDCLAHIDQPLNRSTGPDSSDASPASFGPVQAYLDQSSILTSELRQQPNGDGA